MARKDIEKRFFAAKPELRQADGSDGALPDIVGYPAVFNRESEDLGGFIEIIEPGAFARALRNSPDVVALKNHNYDLIFGRRGVNMVLTEDDKGLRMDVSPVDTAMYRGVVEDIGADLLTAQSFGFRVARDEWENLQDGTARRIILEFEELYDVSVVAMPAYPDTSVALRRLDLAVAQNIKTFPRRKIKLALNERML